MFPPDQEYYGKCLVLAAMSIAIIIYALRIIKAGCLAAGG